VGFITDIQKAHGIISEPKALNKERIQQLITASGYGAGVIGEDEYVDQQKLSRYYEKISWVYRCVYLIASNLSRLPIKVVRYLKNGDEKDVSDMRTFRVLQKPNAWQSKLDFYTESYSRLELQGELFWELQIGDRGTIEAMYADWRSEEIQIVGDPEAYIAKYIRLINGKRISFTPDEVFYLKYFNPYSTLRGLSPLKPIANAAGLNLEAVNFNKAFFKSGMKLAGVLETEDEIDASESRRIKKKFTEMYAGTEQMHQIAVITGGLKFTPLNSMTLSEAQFTDLLEMSKEEIAAGYGIPLEVLGIGKATYENVKYARRMFWTETLQPKMDKVLEILNTFYLPKLTKDHEFEIKTSYENVEALKEDKRNKIDIYAIGTKNKAISPNEMRVDVFGKDPWDDPVYDEPIEIANPIQPVVDPDSKKKAQELMF